MGNHAHNNPTWSWKQKQKQGTPHCINALGRKHTNKQGTPYPLKTHSDSTIQNTWESDTRKNAFGRKDKTATGETAPKTRQSNPATRTQH